MADETKPEPKQEAAWPSGAIARDKIKKWGALAVAVAVVVLFIALTKPVQPIAQPTVTRFDPNTTVPPSPSRLAEMKKALDDQAATLRKQQESVEAANNALLAAQQNPQGLPPTTPAAGPGATPSGATAPGGMNAGQQYPTQYPAESASAPTKPKTVSTIVQDLRAQPTQSAEQHPLPPMMPPPVALPQTASYADSGPAEQNAEQSAAKPELKKVDLLRPPNSAPKVVLPEGAVMESVLVNKLDGSSVGEIKCMLTTDVYEPDTHILLFPQGTELVGETSTVSTFGQSRLAAKLHRAIVHQGNGNFYSVSLDQGMPGLDSEGATGLRGKVNNHWFATFGVAGVIGAIAGLSEIGNTASTLTINPMAEFRTGVTQNMSQESMQIMGKFLNRPPTITIPPGTRVKLLTISDLEIPIFKEAR